MFSSTKPPAIPASRDLAVKNRPFLSGAGNAPSIHCAVSQSGIFLLLIVTMGVLVLPVSADLSHYQSPLTGRVYVSDSTSDPAIFFSGDSGTVSFTVVNGNTNISIMVNHATFSDINFRRTSDTYDYSTPLGPLQSKTFTFSVVTNAPEGFYYPSFSLDMYDSNLYYNFKMQVDNTPIELTVLDKPDAFAQSKKKTIYMQVANPRDNVVRNVVLGVSGAGITATPSRIFIGDISPDTKIPVNFSVTPDQPTTLQLTLNYYNGVNPHKVTMDLPVTFGTDKKEAHPVISNVQVKSDAGIYHITGDVNNAGLENANSVIVTTISPAIPQDPYKNYVVGALKPDDFASFEVTFSTENTTSVPLQLSYKDADGNVITSRQDVTITVADSAQNTVQPSLLPVIGTILFIALAGGYLYLKRRKNQ